MPKIRFKNNVFSHPSAIPAPPAPKRPLSPPLPSIQRDWLLRARSQLFQVKKERSSFIYFFYHYLKAFFFSFFNALTYLQKSKIASLIMISVFLVHVSKTLRQVLTFRMFWLHERKLVYHDFPTQLTVCLRSLVQFL